MSRGALLRVVVAICLQIAVIPRALAQPAAATEPVTSIDLAHQIVALAYPPDFQRQKFFGNPEKLVEQATMNLPPRFISLAQRNPSLQTVFQRWTEQFITRQTAIEDAHIAAIMESIAQGYAAEFSKDELRQLLEFFHGPLGSHFIDKGLSLLPSPQLDAANKSYLADSTKAAVDMSTEFGVSLKAYFRVHPELASELKGS